MGKHDYVNDEKACLRECMHRDYVKTNMHKNPYTDKSAPSLKESEKETHRHMATQGHI
jgi:hypothetical protein